MADNDPAATAALRDMVAELDRQFPRAEPVQGGCLCDGGRARRTLTSPAETVQDVEQLRERAASHAAIAAAKARTLPSTEKVIT